MNFKVIKTIFIKEIRSIVRDKKSMFKLFLIPFFIPAYIFFFSFFYSEPESMLLEDSYVVGSNYELSTTEKVLASELGLEFKYYESKEDMDKAFKDKEIAAYIILSDETKYTVYMEGSSASDSSFAGAFALSYLDAYNKYLANNYLTGEGIDTDKAFNQITVATEELESESDYMINILISFSMTFTLMSAIYASVYGATDVVAGEKERGTLETMVTFPVSNVDIMAGKFLGILCSSIIVAVFALLLTYGSFFISGLLFSVYDKVNLNITLSGLLLTMLTILSGCVISSGVCIALASYCNNYKEAQETTGFITMFSIIPMFIEMMKVEAAWWIYLIPLCGQGIMLDKILYNEFNLTNFIILISSSVIISILLIVFNAKRYKSEKAIFG